MNERVTVLLFRRVPSGIRNPASTISSSKPLLHSGSLLEPHRPLVLKILRILTSSLAEELLAKEFSGESNMDDILRCLIYNPLSTN